MDLTPVIHAYRTFDPAAWVGVYRLLPSWAGIILIAAGVCFLVFGGGKPFRFVAGPAGALIGFLWAPILTAKFGLQIDANIAGTIAAVALGVLSFTIPASVVFFGVGLPVGFFAGNLAGSNDWFLGFAPGFLATGTVAAIFTRYIGSVLASALGAWLLVLGVLTALHSVAGVVTAVANQPYGVILAAALFALAGSIFQIFVRPSPEEAERLRIERLKAKRRLEEKKALEKRWAQYGSPSDD
ncbi:MAG: hypothetical protein IRZ16_19240 [Myxococcaceae bacterium]|nr:hypothetical protein [Myxococcaceae bacterium]